MDHSWTRVLGMVSTVAHLTLTLTWEILYYISSWNTTYLFNMELERSWSCQTALGALDSVNSILVWKCLLTLTTLVCLNTVLVRWVPGYRGIKGNEEHDILAEKEAMSPFVVPKSMCDVSHSADGKIVINQWGRKEQDQRWQASLGNTMFKHIIRESCIMFFGYSQLLQ